MERLKIIRPAQPDGGAVIAVAPADIIPSVDAADAGVVSVFAHGHFGVALKDDGLRGDVPVDAVFAEAGINIHADGFGITAENAGEAVLKRNDRTVENTVADGGVMPPDDWVCAVAPYWHGLMFRFGLPRKSGQRGCDDLSHKTLLFYN